MRISWRRLTRAGAVGLLVLLLVVSGAVPVAAGAPGPAGDGPRGRDAPRSDGGGRHDRASAKQVSAGSGPASRTSKAAASRPARQSAGAAPRTTKPHAAAPAKPAAGRTTEPAERKPERQKGAPAPDRKVDDDAQRRGSKSPAPRPTTEVRSSTASPARAASRPDRPRQVRAPVRPVAVVVASSADPTAALFPPPPVVQLQAAAVELEPRQLWPRLPGAAGHPAFPALLAAVLVGFVILGLRGDRQDPKLAAAAIDGRDDRAEFR